MSFDISRGEVYSRVHNRLDNCSYADESSMVAAFAACIAVSRRFGMTDEDISASFRAALAIEAGEEESVSTLGIDGDETLVDAP